LRHNLIACGNLRKVYAPPEIASIPVQQAMTRPISLELLDIRQRRDYLDYYSSNIQPRSRAVGLNSMVMMAPPAKFDGRGLFIEMWTRLVFSFGTCFRLQSAAKGRRHEFCEG
jgi:hypothetical protein